MKLRNKKTGEIVEPFGITCINGRTFVRFDDGKGTFKFEVHSLAELNAEWEDYEEPKEYWYIDYDGGILCGETDNSSAEKMMISMGNHFESLEEAEKAVEKLKAFKRLKDKGFRFVGVRGIGKVIDFDIPAPYNHVAFDEYNANEDELEFYTDLMLIFGGEK